MITWEFIRSLLRHILTTAGGTLAAKGYVSGSEAESLTAAGLVIAGLIWSWLEKRLAAGKGSTPPAGTPLALLGMGLLVMGTGCARFGTVQEDTSYGDDGKPIRRITTRASGYTLAAGNSKLAQWKASQTDKTQGASVAGLDQSSDVAPLARSIAEGIAAGLTKGVTGQ